MLTTRTHRSVGVLGAVIAVMMVLAATAVPASAATKTRTYPGRTTQDKRIRFVVQTTDSGRRFIHSARYFVTLTCEDATTQEWGVGWSYSRRGVELDEQDRFALDDVNPDMATHLAGRIGHRQGSGTLRVTIPALTETEDAQTCTTGDLTWTVERAPVVVPARTSTSSAGLDGRVTFRVAGDGSVSTRVTRY